MARGKFSSTKARGSSLTGRVKASRFVLNAVVTMIRKGERKIILNTIVAVKKRNRLMFFLILAVLPKLNKFTILLPRPG
jgi:hypothetical protein